MDKSTQKPYEWSIAVLGEPLKEVKEKEFESEINITKSKLAAYYADGIIEESLTLLREKHHIPKLDFEDDFCDMTDAPDQSVYACSTWYGCLTPEQDKELTTDVLLELQHLKLPLTLIEKYTEALLYNFKIKQTLNPATFLFNLVFIVDKFKELHLSTFQKKYLNSEIRRLLKLPKKGRIPKDKEIYFDWMKTVQTGKNQSRPFRNNREKLAAIAPKKEYDYHDPVSEKTSKVKETDFTKASKLYPKETSDSAELKTRNRLKKDRQRLRVFKRK
jgi:hypothetical protein